MATAKPTLAGVSVLVVWPTLAKTDIGQTDIGQTDFGQADFGQADIGQADIGQTEFDLCLCVFVWRGCWFHGFGVGFQSCSVPPEPPFPGFPGPPSLDHPSRDRPSPGLPKFSLFFPLPPQNSFFSSLPPFGAPLFQGWAPHPSNHHLSPPTHVTSTHTKKL